jgi:hypothetical protein
VRRWWHRFVLSQSTRGVGGEGGRGRGRGSRLGLMRKESAVWSALCNVGGEWCWVWNMEQIVGVWRGGSSRVGWSPGPGVSQ